MNIFLIVSIFYLCKTNTPIFSWEKKEKGLDYKKTFIFNKIVHFLHFKKFSSIIIFMRCNTFFKPFSRCFVPNKSYFNWYLQSYSNPSVYFYTCNFATCILSGQAKELVKALLRKRGTCPRTSSLLK